jgi:anti-sigma B factor antagonist
MSDKPPESSPVFLRGSDAPIRVQSVRHGAGEMTIELAGEIRLDSAEFLPSCILRYQEEGKSASIMLDFHQIQFVDSQGLALLYSLSKSLRDRGCALAICHASPHVANLIELTRLADYIKLIP